jgi:putative DNA-invertase from lambdoid prophage Rac
MSRTFAYCRVSTQEQHAENQVLEIASAGFDVRPERIVTETISGSVPAMRRKQFARLVDRLEQDDVLIVTKLDRLGRNSMDVRSTVEALAERGVRTHCLALGGVDLTSAAGKMTMMVIAAVGEMERDLLISRTHAGLIRAKSQNKRLGRPSALSVKQLEMVNERRIEGASLATIAKEFEVSKSVIHRATKAQAA